MSWTHSVFHSEEVTIRNRSGQNPQMTSEIANHTAPAISHFRLASKANAASWGFINTSGIPTGMINIPIKIKPSRFPIKNTQRVGSDRNTRISG